MAAPQWHAPVPQASRTGAQFCDTLPISAPQGRRREPASRAKIGTGSREKVGTGSRGPTSTLVLSTAVLGRACLYRHFFTASWLAPDWNLRASGNRFRHLLTIPLLSKANFLDSFQIRAYPISQQAVVFYAGNHAALWGAQ
jgi:hypothetical protein